MRINQTFRVERPVAEVWLYLANVPAVAKCLSGAEIIADRGDGSYAGKVSVKLGPFSAAFEGEAIVERNDTKRSGRVEGKGVDRRGGSRSRMVMDYRVLEDRAGSRIEFDADVTLSGPIAQFGRVGLMQEAANILIRDFAACLEAKMVVVGTRAAQSQLWQTEASATPRDAKLSMLGVLWRAVTAWFGRLFRTRGRGGTA
jgi:carbon monoxide dehydrogenase subunit G